MEFDEEYEYDICKNNVYEHIDSVSKIFYLFSSRNFWNKFQIYINFIYSWVLMKKESKLVQFLKITWEGS